MLSSFLLGKSEPVMIDKPTELIDRRLPIRVLLLRQDRIGDVLISVPFVRELRITLPNARIDVLFGIRNIGARKALDNHIDHYYVYTKKLIADLKLISALKKKKYDIVIDLFDNPSTTSTLILSLLKSRIRIGLDKENFSAYTHVVPMLDKQVNHIVKRVAMLLLPFGIEPEKIDYSLEYPLTIDDIAFAQRLIPNQPGFTRLGINISGSDRAKFWGTENLIAFIKDVKRNYSRIEVVLFGTNDYNAEIEMITRAASVISAPMVGSMHEWACLLNTCDIIFTPDTAAVHLASAWQIPCLAIYNISGIAFAGMPWIPIGTSYKVLTTTKETLAEISPERVFKAFSELFEKNFEQ